MRSIMLIIGLLLLITFPVEGTELQLSDQNPTDPTLEKEIFAAPVRVFAQLFPKNGKARFHSDFVVLKDGSEVGLIRYNGGGEIEPGTYTLEVRDTFTPFRVENVQITGPQNTTFVYEIPVGHIEVEFSFQVEPKSHSRLARIYRLNATGSPMSGHVDIKPGETKYLVPGRYLMKARRPTGSFTPVKFTVSAETSQTLVLQQE